MPQDYITDITDIQAALQAAGVPLGRHASGKTYGDLYARVTPESRAIVSRYVFKRNVTIFRCNIDRELWFDIPFAYYSGGSKENQTTTLPELCTCHKDGTCNCLGVSIRDGRGPLYCKVCGETEAHCDHGCVCEAAKSKPTLMEMERFRSDVLGKETYKTQGIICPKCRKTSPTSEWGNRPRCPGCGWR